MKLNVLGTPLVPCSKSPMTGFYRDGHCRTDELDRGRHVVCVQVTADFLRFTQSVGNDLSTPIEGMFPGLKPGDWWCLCALRWVEAYQAGMAPNVYLEATEQAMLNFVSLEELKLYAVHKP
jgi:uncharacterized protein (DUF2237 family)